MVEDYYGYGDSKVFIINFGLLNFWDRTVIFGNLYQLLHVCTLCIEDLFYEYCNLCWILLCTCVCFSDTLVEQEVDGTSVAEIFKHHGEGFFRKKEVSYELFLYIHLLQTFSIFHGLFFLLHEVKLSIRVNTYLLKISF